MSGGYFDYKEWHIKNMIEEIERIMRDNNMPKRKEDLEPWDYDETGQIKEKNKYYYEYSPETISVFKKAVNALKMAYAYAHRIDYLLEGDDDEDSFHKSLKKDLQKIKNENYG